MTATTTAASTNIYQTTTNNVGSATGASSGAMRKLFGENVGSSKVTAATARSNSTGTKPTRGSMSGQSQQLLTPTSAAAMATHLLDHGYGVTLTPPVSTAVAPGLGQQQTSSVLPTATSALSALGNANTSTSPQSASNNPNSTSPASQQQQQHKYKSTDMTQYYKVNFII